MTMRLVVVLAAGVMLAGCTNTDWDHAFSYVGLDNQSDDGAIRTASEAPVTAPMPAPTAVPVAAPATSAAAADGWCDEAAKAARVEAAEQGFDTETQHRRAEITLQQCRRTQR